MSHLRALNTQHPDENDANAPFWEWVDAMGGGPPDRKGKEEGNGEGSSRNNNTHASYEPYHDYDDHEEDTEMPPPDYDGEDPPTPPEEYPLMNEKTAHLPDRTVEPDSSSSQKKNKKEDEGENDDEGRRCGPGGRGGRGGGRCGGRGGGGGGPGAWHHGHHGPHGHGPWGGPHGHHGPHGHGPWGGRGRGGMFGRGRGGHWGAGGPPPFMMFGGHPAFGGGPFGGARDGTPPNWGNWMEMAKKFAERLGLDPSQIPAMGGNTNSSSNEDGVDFSPAIDVYSTPTEYVVHVALPGANKEDVAVTWDETEAALNVGGVVTRGVDEELANQLALAERPVGVFRRKIRLGDKEHPARVDADGIRAAMEEGVLKIRVRKAEHEPAEIKKVQVQ